MDWNQIIRDGLIGTIDAALALAKMVWPYFAIAFLVVIIVKFIDKKIREKT